MRRSCPVVLTKRAWPRPSPKLHVRCQVTARNLSEQATEDEAAESIQIDQTASSSIPQDPPPTPKKRGRPRKSPPSTDPLPPLKAPHHDLPSFAAYAARTSLSPTSTVYVGTHYEYLAQSTLASHGFALTRTGRSNDLGIDLLGTWTLPLPSPVSLKVTAQCKAEAPKPAHVRELEGAMGNAPPGWRGDRVLGLLIARGPATKGVREAVARARRAMGFVFLEDEGADDGRGRVRQVLWNRGADEGGLEGVGVGTKFDAIGGEEVVLTWEGRPIKFKGS